MESNILRLDFCYLKIFHILHPRYHPKIIGHILKNKQKNKCVCIHEIIRLIITELKTKKKNRSHRHDINRPRSRHGYKYSKYKKCLSMIMLICIKQHLSNIWSSIHEKVKQHWGWVEKRRCLLKKRVFLTYLFRFFVFGFRACIHKHYRKYCAIFQIIWKGEHVFRCFA